MKQPRFIMTDKGLILETPIPLSDIQLKACVSFAIDSYSSRVFRVPSGRRREGLINVISLLKTNNFMERAVPANDYDSEVILHG